MNQHIRIRFKPGSNLCWNIWFVVNNKTHRVKVPSGLNSYGDWIWYIQGRYQKRGYNFDWNES